MTLNTKLMNNKILFLFLACCLFSGCMDKKRNDGGGNPDIILGIKEQMDTITNRYNKWLYLFHISSC